MIGESGLVLGDTSGRGFGSCILINGRCTLEGRAVGEDNQQRDFKLLGTQESTCCPGRDGQEWSYGWFGTVHVHRQLRYQTHLFLRNFKQQAALLVGCALGKI